MIHIENSDMFDIAALHSPVSIAHGVNCKGVMGAGVAKQIRSRYPYAYNSYRKTCFNSDSSDSLLGKVQVIQIPETAISIVNCFTQVQLGANARIDAVETCLSKLANYDESTVVMPLIGGGIGGLNPNDVIQLMQALPDRFILVTQ